MQTFSSAKRTCSASASADECTATDLMPSSRQARITRSAISPRFAIRTFLYMGSQLWGLNPGMVPRPSGARSAWHLGSPPCPCPPLAALGLDHAPLGVCGMRHVLGEADQLLAVLDVLAVLNEDLDDLAVGLGLDLVHELHGLDDADDLPLANAGAHLGEGGRVGRRRAVEGADERRRDE